MNTTFNVFEQQIARLQHLHQRTVYELSKYQKMGNKKMITKHRSKMFFYEDQIEHLTNLLDARNRR